MSDIIPVHLSDAERANMLAQSECVAWLPVELIERHAVRWALVEGIVRVDDVPVYDPDADRWEQQLRRFVDWAKDNVMTHWRDEQARRSVPLVCPSWCRELHGELMAPGVLLPWDMSTTHESEPLAPGTGLDVHVIQLQNHPDEGEEFGGITLHVGGEADFETPAAVTVLAALLEAAAGYLERVQTA